jgi:K+-sensing histidine kinase KdpD
MQKMVFDPFFTTKAAGKGTGLGLWISYNIIEKMGGVEPAKPAGQGRRLYDQAADRAAREEMREERCYSPTYWLSTTKATFLKP